MPVNPSPDLEELARLTVDCGLKVHKDLGPGLLESVYETVMMDRLAAVGLAAERQKVIAVEYQGMIFREGFRADILVDGRLIVELKSFDRLMAVHHKTLLTYLRMAKLPPGLLMNFGGATFREGIRRVVNNHTDAGSSRLRANDSDSGTPTRQA